MIKEIYYTPTAMTHSFTLPELANVTIITFARAGRIHRQVDTVPGYLEFRYTLTGLIEVSPDVPFEGSGTSPGPVVLSQNEIVYIKYKL